MAPDEQDPLDVLLSDPNKEPEVTCEICGKNVPKSHWDNCLERKVKTKLRDINPFKKKTQAQLKHYLICEGHAR